MRDLNSPPAAGSPINVPHCMPRVASGGVKSTASRYTLCPMGNLLVVSAGRGEGKTSVAATLAHRAAAAGRSAAAIKPFGAGGEVGPGSDALIFERLVGTTAGNWPAALAGGDLPESELNAAAEAVASLGSDSVAVEASSELAPRDCARLAEVLEAKVLVVARHRHGMSAADVLERTGPYGDRVAGVLLNCRGTYMGTEAASLTEEVEAAGTRVLGTIPEDRRLLGVAVRQIAAHLGGRFLLGEDQGADELVEHFLVGGWMMDEGSRYFETRTDKAVVIRGDRPDLQMSALSTPTKALVLTSGIEPIEYVLYEAQEEETCLVVVDQDTISTMEALGTIVESARFDHPDKLARMSDLFDSHADGAALSALT